MTNRAPSRRKVDEVLTTDPLTVFEWRIQPVAHLQGRETNGTEQTGPFFSRTGKLTPIEVRVDGAGGQWVIPIDDPVREPIRAMLVAGAALSAVCSAILLMTPIMLGRKS